MAPEVARDLARKVLDALERGLDWYRSRLRPDHLDPASPQGRRARALVESVEHMLQHREELERELTASIASTTAGDRLPEALHPVFDRLIRDAGAELPRALAQSCRVPLRWFADSARLAQSGEPPGAYQDEQLMTTGLAFVTRLFLQSRSDVNDVLRLLEKGPMHFFKEAVRSQVQSSYHLRASADAEALPSPADPDFDYERLFSTLYSYLSERFAGNPAYHPKEAWLTAGPGQPRHSPVAGRAP